MKYAGIISLAIAAAVALTACGKTDTAVIAADGKSYEPLTVEGGGRALDENGNLIVAAKDKSGKSVTQVLSEKYLIIDDNKLMAPAYDYEIPEDFSLKSSDADPLLENKQGTIQINIVDKTEAAESCEEYALKTYNAAKSAGLTFGEIESVTLKGLPMKRFGVKMQTGDGIQMITYGYFVQVKNRILMITVTSKDGGITGVSQADEYVEEIDFADY